MLLILGVSLYTSRIVLEALGVVDFGIYNVVGGVVFMLAFLTSSMTAATQRFISFELGKNDLTKLNKIFCMSINIHVILAFLILLLAETLGLWFLNSKLTIPADRMAAANWVYQFSILSFLISIIGVPYSATIIAHERIKIYAYISIIEAMLKLITVLALLWIEFDKLKMYAVFISFVSLVTLAIYKIYCKRNFPSTIYTFMWDKRLFNTLLNYSGWNLFGGLAGVTMGQGVNILLNIFFGPTVNAAKGISGQVKGAINMVVTNFQVAIGPQIIKSYAINDIKYMHQIMFMGSKFSFYLLYACSLPILLETEMVLNIWLTKVPAYTIIFVQLAIVNVLIDSVSGSLMTGAQASGVIKKYQSIVGGFLLMNLPLSYIFLLKGFPPQTTFFISIIISVFALYARLFILKSLINLSVKKFFKEIILPIIIVSIVSLIIPLIVRSFFQISIYRVLIIGLFSIASVLTTIYLVGLSSLEKNFLKVKIVNQYIQFKSKF